MLLKLPPEIAFFTGSGKKQEGALQLNQFMMTLEKNTHQQQLASMHSFEVLSGRYTGRREEWCLKVFMACDMKIIEALESLLCADVST